MSLRVVFMGSPEFAVPPLRAIHSRFRLVGVMTQPDRPKGRGRKTVPTAVKAAALELGVPIAEPDKLASSESIELLKYWNPDVIVVAAYGKILPKVVLELPEMGCINLHASLLPRHRGASPISAAILAGDTVTGVCTMVMDEGMDTGDILLKKEVPIAPDDTAGTLHDKLLEPGADLVVKTLKMMAGGNVRPEPQDESAATYSRLLTKDDGRIDWNHDADFLHRLVRAMNPWPGAFFSLAGVNVKVWEAAVEEGESGPGHVMGIKGDGVSVGTGTGQLRLCRVQAPGKKPVFAAEYARGRRLKVGDILA
ncbi:MAG: methionyl-tRNA formyltransferase [Desulfomonilaceae bacterium]|nr:methionyl-tRNA formyltransferase [Desulfomonilaceae bacterium]